MNSLMAKLLIKEKKRLKYVFEIQITLTESNGIIDKWGTFVCRRLFLCAKMALAEVFFQKQK